MATLYIRNVPEDVRQALKLRAKVAGQSLPEYALAELTRSLRRPTLHELTRRIRRRGEQHHGTAASEILYAERTGEDR